MDHGTSHSIVFVKDSQRQLNEKAMTNNSSHILGVNNKSLQSHGWIIVRHDVNPYDQEVNWERVVLMDDSSNDWRYYLHFSAEYAGDKAPGNNDLRSIVKTMATRAGNPVGGRWAIHTVDGKPYTVTDDGEVTTKDFLAYTDVEIPEDYEGYFSHLFGLDSHIGRIRGALEAAIMSNFSNRYHVALIGPPGCGKSDICQTLKKALGEEAVLEFDATATTAAGAIKELDQREILPRVLLVEEIEKADEKALSFLLALCDLRGEIRKTTARAAIQKDTKLLVIATVNNHELFEKLQAGALSSRFANKLWFRRPSPEMLRSILEREVGKVDGDEAWIQPTLDYAKEKDINDPRMITALCLCGRDGWLDGSFYEMLADTDKPQDY